MLPLDIHSMCKLAEQGSANDNNVLLRSRDKLSWQGLIVHSKLLQSAGEDLTLWVCVRGKLRHTFIKFLGAAFCSRYIVGIILCKHTRTLPISKALREVVVFLRS